MKCFLTLTNFLRNSSRCKCVIASNVCSFLIGINVMKRGSLFSVLIHSVLTKQKISASLICSWGKRNRGARSPGLNPFDFSSCSKPTRFSQSSRDTNLTKQLRNTPSTN